MCSVSFRISSGASNSIVSSIICFCFCFFVFCSRLALVLYVVCRCCNKVSFKRKKKKKKKKNAEVMSSNPAEDLKIFSFPIRSCINYVRQRDDSRVILN